jgi:L-iditol 2-dehydrogenase
MKVLKYYAPKTVRIEEMPVPEIEPREVLLSVKACGICASDVKTYLRGHPKIEVNTVLGHEVCGVIEQVEGVPGWQVGERVVVAPYAPCGDCYFCRRGEPTRCPDLLGTLLQPGGFSQYLKIPSRIVEKGLFRLPAGLSIAEGTLIEPIACCYHGLEVLDLGEKDSLLIVGDGPMGILQAEIARAMGARLIILSGITEERLLRGGKVADHTINPLEEDLRERVLALTEGRGVDKAIVSLGIPEVVQQSFALVRRGGFLNLFAGLPGNLGISVDPNRIHYDELTVVGTFGFSPDHFRKSLDLVERGQIDVGGIVTGRVRLEEIEEAFQETSQYKGIKTVVVF